jgi:hypothetical protein
MAGVLKARELSLELLIFPVQEIAENMQFGLSPPGTKLDAGNHFDAKGMPGCDGLGQARDGIVIGNRQGGDLRLAGQGKYIGGRLAAIRKGCVEMKVQSAHAILFEQLVVQ